MYELRNLSWLLLFSTMEKFSNVKEAKRLYEVRMIRSDGKLVIPAWHFVSVHESGETRIRRSDGSFKDLTLKC